MSLIIIIIIIFNNKGEIYTNQLYRCTVWQVPDVLGILGILGIRYFSMSPLGYKSGNVIQ